MISGVFSRDFLLYAAFEHLIMWPIHYHRVTQENRSAVCAINENRQVSLHTFILNTNCDECHTAKLSYNHREQTFYAIENFA